MGLVQAIVKLLQTIDVRLRVKTLGYSQYTPICQNDPAPPSWRLPSADEVFVVLVPCRLHPSEPLCEPPDCWVVGHKSISHSAMGRFDEAVGTVLAHQCSLVYRPHLCRKHRSTTSLQGS
ncbi:hypothetical protein M513_10551 [Trichuris suis]|uniref:Uncharacterized protein n=1 Tax=Trichuris suis TaxID=68888 RepID=A0A085LU94_9BILA|nr:hypothetical protein M513_10551 [Trichuris suis]